VNPFYRQRKIESLWFDSWSAFRIEVLHMMTTIQKDRKEMASPNVILADIERELESCADTR